MVVAPGQQTGWLSVLAPAERRVLAVVARPSRLQALAVRRAEAAEVRLSRRRALAVRPVEVEVARRLLVAARRDGAVVARPSRQPEAAARRAAVEPRWPAPVRVLRLPGAEEASSRLVAGRLDPAVMMPAPVQAAALLSGRPFSALPRI